MISLNFNRHVYYGKNEVFIIKVMEGLLFNSGIWINIRIMVSFDTLNSITRFIIDDEISQELTGDRSPCNKSFYSIKWMSLS